eukprot:EG_transcript_25374
MPRSIPLPATLAAPSPAPAALAAVATLGSPSSLATSPKQQTTLSHYIRPTLKAAATAEPPSPNAAPAPPARPFAAAPLPYAYDALAAKGISREQVTVHYDKHHKGYAQKLTELVQKDPKLQGLSLGELLLTQSPGPVFNCAAQIWNHDFYWRCMAPTGGGPPPDSPLKQQIEKQFGSFEQFKADFTAAALSHFGSGWAWLVKTPLGSLAVVTTKDADIPALRGLHPILVCDVWEHAYYIDHRNDRAKHLSTFWDVVN